MLLNAQTQAEADPLSFIQSLKDGVSMDSHYMQFHNNFDFWSLDIGASPETTDGC